MSFVQEFREFAVKGNVVDLAVGVIIGAAFGKIVDSVVKDLMLPIVGRFVGGLDFSNYFLKLADPPAGYNGPMTYEALTKAGVPLFAYGNFITVASGTTGTAAGRHRPVARYSRRAARQARVTGNRTAPERSARRTAARFFIARD